jgi:hypothetical protein
MGYIPAREAEGKTVFARNLATEGLEGSWTFMQATHNPYQLAA